MTTDHCPGSAKFPDISQTLCSTHPRAVVTHDIHTCTHDATKYWHGYRHEVSHILTVFLKQQDFSGRQDFFQAFPWLLTNFPDSHQNSPTFRQLSVASLSKLRLLTTYWEQCDKHARIMPQNTGAAIIKQFSLTDTYLHSGQFPNSCQIPRHFTAFHSGHPVKYILVSMILHLQHAMQHKIRTVNWQENTTNNVVPKHADRKSLGNAKKSPTNLGRIRCPLPLQKLTWCSCFSDCWVASTSPWLPEAGNQRPDLEHRCLSPTAPSCWGPTISSCCDGNTLSWPSRIQTYQQVSLHKSQYINPR